MMSKNRVLAVAALLIGLLLPGQLLAAWTAITRADLNLRVGPDTAYGVIDVIPAGEPVDVIGCISGLEWCDVEWLGLRGFVSAYYLVQPGTSVYLPHYAPSVGVPIISFSFNTYHDRHYRDRSWYRERYWGGHWLDRDRHHVIIEEPRRKKYREPKRKDYYVEKPRRKEYYVEEPPRKKVHVEEPRRKKVRVEEPQRIELEPHERRKRRVPDTPPVPVWGQ